MKVARISNKEYEYASNKFPDLIRDQIEDFIKLHYQSPRFILIDASVWTLFTHGIYLTIPISKQSKFRRE